VAGACPPADPPVGLGNVHRFTAFAMHSATSSFPVVLSVTLETETLPVASIVNETVTLPSAVGSFTSSLL
jgi:hypothetical protein